MCGQQLPVRRIPFRRPVRPHRGMRVITHLKPKSSPSLVETVVTPSPPRDKHSISCGRVLHVSGARTFLSALGLRGAPGLTGMSALLSLKNPPEAKARPGQQSDALVLAREAQLRKPIQCLRLERVMGASR